MIHYLANMRVDDGQSDNDYVPVSLRVYACKHVDVCLFELYAFASVPVCVSGCVYEFLYENLVYY